MEAVKHIVGIADMKISAQPGDLILTFALGSCLGIAIHDPVARVGGLLHVMLPDSKGDEAKAAGTPFKFIDTGLPKLFIACYKAGAQRDRIVVKVAGGSSSKLNPADDSFQIGKRNFLALKKMLWKNGVVLKSHDVGGSQPRTMSLEIGTGEVTVKSNGGTIIL